MCLLVQGVWTGFPAYNSFSVMNSVGINGLQLLQKTQFIVVISSLRSILLQLFCGERNWSIVR